MGLIRSTAALWGPAAFAGAAVFAAEQQPGYSHRTHHVSGLAASGEQSARLMIPGFLALGASQLLMPMRTVTGALLARLAGIGVTVAGLAQSSTPECPQPNKDPEATTSDLVHTVASVATFVTWTSMPLLAARGSGPWWFRRVSALLGALGVASFATAAVTTQTKAAQLGTAQRVFLGVIFTWQIVAMVERFFAGVSSRTSAVARRSRQAISAAG